MIDNPADLPYPEGDYPQVTIKARRLPNGVWEVWCTEWKCTLHDKNLTRCVAGLCAEIENHNESCRDKRHPDSFNPDYNKWADANEFPHLRPEHWPKPPKIAFGNAFKTHDKQP